MLRAFLLISSTSINFLNPVPPAVQHTPENNNRKITCPLRGFSSVATNSKRRRNFAKYISKENSYLHLKSVSLVRIQKSQIVQFVFLVHHSLIAIKKNPVSDGWRLDCSQDLQNQKFQTYFKPVMLACYQKK